ncbi:MAG: DNA-processing protein DprA [Bacillota bacterium]|nr:DNA-processing protein DprA [Bacillota bacterium]
MTVELTENLSKRNIPIISGMAKGIDGYSHTVALHNDNYIPPERLAVALY